MFQSTRWSVAILTFLYLGCSSTSTETEGIAAESDDSNRSVKPDFELPDAPDGTKMVAHNGFQLYVPDDWTIEKREDSPYHYLEGEWQAERPAGSEVVGSLGVSRGPAKGKSLQQLADDRVSLFKRAEGGPVVGSDVQSIQLPDGSDAIYVFLQVNEDSGLYLYHYVFTKLESADDSYWLVSMLLAGIPEDHLMEAAGTANQLIETCVKSFVTPAS